MSAWRNGQADDGVRVHRVGQENQSVVVVEAATGIADALIDYAATRSLFAPAGAVGQGYPGLLGPAPATYLDRMVKCAVPLIAAHFGTGPVLPVRARGNFSLVTVPANDLGPEQRVPHVDTVEPLQFACVHYLCDEAHGGTGFFQHRATGFETLDAARLPVFRAALDRELADVPAGYPTAGNDGPFAMIHACEAARDRLILYRASALHSGLIASIGAHATDPRRGRLTGNLFLQVRQVAA